MKTKFEIEIETKDSYEVHPDVEKEPEDYEKEELEEYRKDFTEELHRAVVNFFERQFSEEDIEDHLMDSSYLDECTIEGWETLEDYGIKFKVKRLK